MFNQNQQAGTVVASPTEEVYTPTDDLVANSAGPLMGSGMIEIPTSSSAPHEAPQWDGIATPGAFIRSTNVDGALASATAIAANDMDDTMEADEGRSVSRRLEGQSTVSRGLSPGRVERLQDQLNTENPMDVDMEDRLERVNQVMDAQASQAAMRISSGTDNMDENTATNDDPPLTRSGQHVAVPKTVAIQPPPPVRAGEVGQPIGTIAAVPIPPVPLAPPERIYGEEPDNEPQVGDPMFEPDPMAAPGDSESEGSIERFAIGPNAPGYDQAVRCRRQLYKRGFRQNETPMRTQLRMGMYHLFDKVIRLFRQEN